jgi:hypothetical protein
MLPKKYIISFLFYLLFGWKTSATANSEVRDDRHTAADLLFYQPKDNSNPFQVQTIEEENTEAFKHSPTLQIYQGPPTANQLGDGQFLFKITNRLFFLDTTEAATSIYTDASIAWGVTDSLELTLDYQRVDSGSGLVQGRFNTDRAGEDAGFDEFTLEAKQRIWSNEDESQALSAVVSLSNANRGVRFFDTDGNLVKQDAVESIIPTFQVPFTYSTDGWQFSLIPSIAFFRDDSAAYFFRPPESNESFGTTFGFAGAISYNINPHLTLWSDAFIPITGNNSVDQTSGEPNKAIAFNFGLRYLLNPRLAFDIFASNTLGDTGALALTAEEDDIGFGVGVTFMPDFINANRQVPASFDEDEAAEKIETPLLHGGFGFFDGGTLSANNFLFNIQGSNSNLASSLRYGMLDDLEINLFIDYVFGDTDESEQGIGGKIRFLNQATGNPFTLSLTASFSQTNEPFLNFFNNDKNAFAASGLDKTAPFLFKEDDGNLGRLFIVNVSLPIHYQFDSGAAVWVTPTVGYVQRIGVEIAGFDFGVSLPLTNDLDAIGEIGYNFAGNGNAFSDDSNSLEDSIPWTIGLRWDLANILSWEKATAEGSPQLEFYVTNRVGSSSWHQLRVREGDSPAVGVGISIPF